MKEIENEQGQALIELIIFLPLMFMFYAMISGFANAINGSINQQKITRSYFYYRAQNNSTIPKPNKGDGGSYAHENWKQFGMFFIGWRDDFVDGKPMAPCYQLTGPFGPSDSDTCESTEYSQPTTQFIRVQSVYGICGGTYISNGGNDVALMPDAKGSDYATVFSRNSCVITN